MTGAFVFAICTLVVFVFTTVISKYLIPILKSKKMGQKILDIGPRWHKSKEGTPTMGGLAFFVSVTAFAIVFSVIYAINRPGELDTLYGFLMAIGLAVSNGLIGIIDDMTKFKKSQNEGLTPSQKFFLQLLFAALYLFGMTRLGLIHTSVKIPFTDISLELGVVYYALSMILITGLVNSVNLTDGIDGLCSMVTFVVGLFFFGCGISFDSIILSAIGGLLCGACGGFLVYNYYPARVFMGDTGSLFLGGLVSGGAFLLGEPYIIIFAGIIYITESVSVILQVAYFKTTGKRLFKMSPIHHHFERCEWSEIKIDYVFSIVTALFCVFAYLMLR